MSSPEDPQTTACKSFVQSLTLKGAMAMAVAFGAGKLGVDASDPSIQGLADALVNLVFYGGLMAVGIGRARAQGPLS